MMTPVEAPLRFAVIIGSTREGRVGRPDRPLVRRRGPRGATTSSSSVVDLADFAFPAGYPARADRRDGRRSPRRSAAPTRSSWSPPSTTTASRPRSSRRSTTRTTSGRPSPSASCRTAAARSGSTRSTSSATVFTALHVVDACATASASTCSAATTLDAGWPTTRPARPPGAARPALLVGPRAARRPRRPSLRLLTASQRREAIMSEPPNRPRDRGRRPGQVVRRHPRGRRRRPARSRPARVYGLLGPNGAGKTTAVRMLATLLRPDGGEARVFGHDVVREADAVRGRVSLTGQYASVDEDLTGTENLVLLGRLLGHRKAAARERAAQLLDGVRPDRRGRPAGEEVLRRHAAAHRHRRQHPQHARPAVPRRADHRPRPAQPQPGVGDHPGGRRARHDGAAHHAVPGRGRPAGRPDRGRSTTAR